MRSWRPTSCIRTRGKKGERHLDPDDPPRRRANKKPGHGTYETDRPPIFTVKGRESGHLRCFVRKSSYVIGGRRDVPGSTVTSAFHLCRGNQGSRWLVSGSYEPIARRVFGGVDAERLILEYDDERSGSFEPLSHVPENKVAVLGLVTTKSSRHESVEELRARVEEVRGFVELERLAISPQCGFSTSTLGNAASVDDEERKLSTLVEAAGEIWG